MVYIIIGFIIFTAIHILTLATTERLKLINKYGEVRYKLVFSLISLIGLSLMLYARFDSGHFIKESNEFFYHFHKEILYIATILIVAAYIPKNSIKKYLKHPMLIGIGIWSFTHILINQHLNHILLFTSFLLFSFIMLIGLIKREPTKKLKAEVKYDFLTIILGTISYYTIVITHKYLAGIPLGL
jgi:uncharacterized membrane protein